MTPVWWCTTHESGLRHGPTELEPVVCDFHADHERKVVTPCVFVAAYLTMPLRDGTPAKQ